ncbi:acetyltransferase, GNAT family [Hyphomonas neptunium ATCC 15444]|uniref:Acetyltransferase, GNAT family n=2 Tax=Hyphomonas TaxID=85 RepID=Q0BY40_HYPNA|nr:MULTISPECIES: GNAT family N-acetyltransferase [Hyphomonas]ABI75357.1 acetyltransferase, GNAT family [Hyphomonas neptunium ATCC 15444]KCZ93707.1 acetyltransferase [Hyphomonas hirschiana VP5]
MTQRGFSTRLKAGDAVFLRPIGPQDRAREVDIISKFSEHSRYLRFFSGAPTLPDAVIDQLVAVDGYNHIAWGALDLNVAGAPLMGVVRAVRRGQSDEADLAMGVLDEHHGKGLARLLMAAVVHDAIAAGITRFTAEMLAENAPARKLFQANGGKAAGRDGNVISFRFDAREVATRLSELGAGEAMDDLREALAVHPLPRRRTAVA